MDVELMAFCVEKMAAGDLLCAGWSACREVRRAPRAHGRCAAGRRDAEDGVP